MSFFDRSFTSGLREASRIISRTPKEEPAEKTITPPTKAVRADEDHPKLAIVQEILSRRPELTKHFFNHAYGIAHPTMVLWEEKGLCTFGKPTKQHPWSGKGKPDGK